MDHLSTFCQNPSFASACLKDWDKFGRKNFLIKYKEAGTAHSLRLLLDLFVKLIGGEGKVDILTKLVPELMRQHRDDAGFESKFLDLLWLLDSTVTDIQSEPVRDRYFRLLHLCKTHVNPTLLMERLSEETLENMSLIQSKQQFQTRYVRTKTRLFFKQQKFNLLREENEGYAKLITELAQASGSMDAVMTQIRSLIGYFDLDPNRVLDLILDVCEFREPMTYDLMKLIRLYNPDKTDLTHILGHKFHFTQEPGDTTPQSLYKVAALLISDGLVNLDILYGHLCPPDTNIQSTRSRLLSSAKAYRARAPANLTLANSAGINISLNNMLPGEISRNELATGSILQSAVYQSQEPGIRDTMANGWPSNGPLMEEERGLTEDSPLGNLGSTALGDICDDKELDPTADALYENNQKLELCSAMLDLGDWVNAQAILDRFQGYWSTGHNQLCKSMCNLLHYLIEPLYSKTCPLPSCLQRTRFRPSARPILARHGSIHHSVESSPQESNSTCLLQPVDDFGKLARIVLPIAMYLGPNMSTDVPLMVKFCRLGYVYLSDQNTRAGTIDSVYQGFFNLLDEVLLPSLSLVDANCCLAEEIWQMMRFLPYDHRYRLYGQWKHMTAQSEPRIVRKKAQVLVCAKAIMKRLSKENVKPMGRQLGKLSHGNPGLLFDHVLSTVQLYTNLIGPVVEALKYVSSLGYDVLTFCIIEALAADESKLEDLQLSQALQALSSFTGLLCKKYQFDLSGLLHYVLNQLKMGKSYDLQILREVLHRMSGIDISEEMTDEQLESMSGGELLLQEGGYYAQIRNTRKNATRLKEALIEHNLIMPFIFLMAQQRDAVVFLDDPTRHVKLAGRLYDQCQGTLVQFITFLGLQLTREEMSTQCLPIERMMGEFHVPADTAFCLHRSLFEQKVALELKVRLESLKSGDSSKLSSKALFAAISQQICAEIASAIRPLYPSRVWDELGTNFFVTFWSLQSSDLVVPEAAYHRQMQQLREQMQQIEITQSGWTSMRKKREIERLQGLIDKLAAEQTERHEHVARVRAWLLAERDSWFQTRMVTKMDTITQFLQLCIYPRVCFTAADAIYVAQFIHVLHQLKTSRFSTLICLDRIFNDITLPTSMCTEDEAHRYGRFLCAVLELVMRWHSSEEIFNQECGQYPGFVTVFRKGSDANTKADQLQYENYRHVVHKWHYRITKATVACLESGSYVQIRNALIVLTRILPQYPRILQFGSAVERRVQKLKEEEKDRRPDLKALAFSYAGLLHPRKAKWVGEEEFHLKENKPTRPDPISSLHGNSGTSHSSSAVSRSVLAGDRAHNMPRTQGHVPTKAVDINHDSSPVRRSGGTPRNASVALETRSRPNPSTQSQSGSAASGSAVEQSTRSSSTSVQQSGTSNLPPSGHSPSNKQRSVARPEAGASSSATDGVANTGDEASGSKRRRVEQTTSASCVPNALSPPGGASSQKAGTGGGGVTDEHRDSRKITRKKSNPALSSAPPSADAQTPLNEGTVRHSGRMPSLSSEQQPQQSSASAPSRHSRRGVQQRASSSNSADSKEDEDRLSSGSKKSKRAHHHHHRHTADSTGDSSPQTAYTPTASEQVLLGSFNRPNRK
ncbi:hypothetical protein CRM22_002996 [Opisthorchis felineus]|uniref:THO complex subunit 2 n=1 Tax=Opisthorchis felineus TaxID=147828 RepID=A0A4S2M804_OPIFE|nr:hypothetical protein CRM22_002996 [Opisthorchis felineus]